MRVLVTPTFARAAKKLHAAQKRHLDQAVQAVLASPESGEAKVGDLAGVRVLKFRIGAQLWLVAYAVTEDAITLLALGSHENFYRDLKR
ncbi:addiction module toxin RelE [Paramagnetospirillum kuznetsovii]|uniref:Addiction module toxin RelE n=1 Tax=Paramagnetospirillum kuznetsovii TaxID=2053833 RepID=A0A364P450_9PROT|nr:type II toxin-antitoxin system RelE/ParE family toxin [Paramagnetospirillum kuznetsovii]RAU23895.1 addiction module toxin RelE [Paramagnetospirillum kuznetsovii]